MPSSGKEKAPDVPSVSSGAASMNCPAAITRPPRITALRWPSQLSAIQPPKIAVP